MNNQDLIHNQHKHMTAIKSYYGYDAAATRVRLKRRIRVAKIKKTISEFTNAFIALILILGATSIGWVILTVFLAWVDNA